ncbi:hypothetical protein WJX74_000193 [Apatococcus lobatus]|uniref:SMP-30/Gluconolactonase/LRE-like region domain-containing protein n=1 Tax=Apatococcus lobatus TaxID=904363 RepID=A0AAW1QYZ5_9CHLO
MASASLPLLLVALFLGSFGKILAQISSVRYQAAGSCSISTEQLRVLPTDYERDVLQAFTTTTAGTGLAAAAQELQNCLFQSYDPAFDVLIGNNRTLYQVGPTRSYNWAHEGTAYLPDSNEVLFFSDAKNPGQANRVSLDTGNVVPVPLESPIGAATGATNYEGEILVATFGDYENGIPAGILQLDVYNGTWKWVLNNWFGLHFNGPNDIVALNDGSFIFTDSQFGVTQGFSPGGAQPAVYLVPPTGPARVIINQLPTTINGLALSADQQTLYVSTVQANNSDPADAVPLDMSNSIYAGNLVPFGGGRFAQNSRVFAVSDHGYADGFKLDVNGNVFASSGDGVDVFGANGSLLGKIIIPASQSSQQTVNNLVFAGSKLVIGHNTDVLMLQLNTTG